MSSSRPNPTIDLTNLHVAVASLRDDMDIILEMRGPEPKTPLVRTAEDTVFATLFPAPTTSLLEPRDRAKKHRSIHNTKRDEAGARRNERTDLEAERRDSLLDEEARQMRARELDAGASSSRVEVVEKSATEGADTVVGTTEGVPTEGADSGISYPASC